MTEFFKMFIDYISGILTCLNNYGFEFFGFFVSVPMLLMSFLIIGFAVSFFWKGART